MPPPNSYEPITLNREVGKQPALGPIPSELVVPFMGSAGIGYLLGYELLGLSLTNSSLVAAALFATWWIVTGGNNWRFLRRFGRWFVPHWIPGKLPYRSFIAVYETPKAKARKRRARSSIRERN